jgi:hypothetical protein
MSFAGVSLSDYFERSPISVVELQQHGNIEQRFFVWVLF